MCSEWSTFSVQSKAHYHVVMPPAGGGFAVEGTAHGAATVVPASASAAPPSSGTVDAPASPTSAAPASAAESAVWYPVRLPTRGLTRVDWLHLAPH